MEEEKLSLHARLAFEETLLRKKSRLLQNLTRDKQMYKASNNSFKKLQSTPSASRKLSNEQQQFVLQNELNTQTHGRSNRGFI